MTRRAWWLVSGAYAIGFLGLWLALALIVRNTNALRDEQQRTTDAMGALCEAIWVPDLGEKRVLIQLSNGTYTPGSPGDPLKTPVCIRLVARLDD
jgi:hypothetical protein